MRFQHWDGALCRRFAETAASPAQIMRLLQGWPKLKATSPVTATHSRGQGHHRLSFESSTPRSLLSPGQRELGKGLHKLDMAFRQRCGDPNPANSFTVGGLSTPPQGLCQVGCPVSVLDSKFQGVP